MEESGSEAKDKLATLRQYEKDKNWLLLLSNGPFFKNYVLSDNNIIVYTGEKFKTAHVLLFIHVLYTIPTPN